MGTGEIWVYGKEQETGAQIAKAFNESNLINPVRVIKSDSDFSGLFRAKAMLPAVLLLDLSEERVWEFISAARANPPGERVPMIALVDDASEALIDKAYDAGVKTYLKKPLVFTDFVLRARLLNLSFLIQQGHRAA
jgi:AmiR/NasT family two-component response regulator